MDEQEKTKAGEDSLEQPNYLVKPDEPIKLVDGIVIETRSDSTVIFSLYMSDPRSKPTTEGEKTEPWLSFCQGRFAMSIRTFMLLKKLVNRHEFPDTKADKTTTGS